ncbi:MAG TPA: hypothetical protein VK578_18985 [Edaphobacter sp.]|nr:hypothetical protein [Edaphobacter sp.]
MSSITLTIHAADLNAVAAVVKNPFVVTAAESQAIKPTATQRPKKVLRQRILAFLNSYPGATTTAIRRGVTGYDGDVNTEVIAMRADGSLRVFQTGEQGDPLRHYIADVIEEREAAQIRSPVPLENP